MPSLEYKALLDQAWDLHVAKNAGYAGAENPDPWANFRMSEAFGVSPLEGCLVRMSDKYIRIANLMKSPANEQVGESIRDTLRDLSAYALIAVCLLDEQSPKERALLPSEVNDALFKAQLKAQLETLRTKCACPGREYGGHDIDCRLREAKGFA